MPAPLDDGTPAVARQLDGGGETQPIRRWGAGAGSRWPALLLIVAVLVIAAVLVAWGLLR